MFFFCPHLNAQYDRAYTVLITEIMFDPEPSVGLPALEYIELFNNGNEVVNLLDWSISIDQSIIKFKDSIILQPQHYLLLTKTNGCPLFDSLISCRSVPGLSLPNTGGSVSIHSPPGKLVHGVVYNADMHSNIIKSKGGWSLEMKDIRTPCLLATNWASSLNRSGGTPGRNNSLHEPPDEHEELQVDDTYMPDSIHAMLTINQGLDSIQLAASFIAAFENSSGPGVSSWQVTGVQQNMVKLDFVEPVQPANTLRLLVEGLKSCVDSNAFSMTVPLAVNASAGKGDLIFNEIMYHPAVNEDEYIELYNSSKKTIDLHAVYLLRIKAGGNADDPVRCSTLPRSVFPGEYVVLSKRDNHIQQTFGTDRRLIRVLDDFPILPDDGALLMLVNESGDSIDLLDYDDSWHLPLIRSDAGIALERISESRPSTSHNWTSAAGPVFGTPGRLNSQHANAETLKGGISVEPMLFTPDLDGNADILFISYKLPTPATIGNVSIVDINGRTIRSLANNRLLGTSGTFSWNGYSDTNTMMPTGVYIVVADFFDLTGKKLKFRQAVTLARR